MAKPLAELRKKSAKSPQKKRRNRRAYQACLAPDILGEMHSLNTELIGLLETTTIETESGARRPRRNASPETARINQIRKRMGELQAQMSDHTGELMLEAIEDGAWDRWVTENPARVGEDDDPAASRLDLQVGAGYCDVDALMSKDQLVQFVLSFDGKPLADGDWDYIYDHLSRGDKKELARLVVVMHEQAVNIPFLQHSWEAAQRSESDSS